MRSHAGRAAAWCAMALLALGATARAAVRMEQDELVFTLRHPGAQEVYLIGDFNRWNPTVERMDANGDVFEVRLFLVAGEYRYKFVVDGVTIDDPDNPGGEQGSPIRLVERSGGLILETDIAGDATPSRTAHAWFRYIGALRVDEGDAEVTQRVDAEVSGAYDRFAARGRVATEDSSWHWSPPSVDAYFDRGRVDLDLGRLDVRAVDNDSVWASSDPMELVGNAGVFGYDAGFRRHGLSAEFVGSRAAVRGLYADASGRTPRTSIGLPTSPLAEFLGGTAPDTTAYTYAYTFDDADVLAIEATADLGALDLGLTLREDRGLNPGVIVDMTRTAAGFDASVLATRETRRVSNAWLTAGNVFGASVTGAFGWGDSEVDAHAAESLVDSLPAVIVPSAGAVPADARAPILDTQRGLVEVEVTPGNVNLRLRWDGTRFDFDGVEGVARADVNRFELAAALLDGDWAFGASVTYTDASYGGAPDALYIDWPELNPWLSLWDDVAETSLVGLGLESHDVVALSAEHGGQATNGGVALVAQVQDVAGELRHASARAWVESTVRARWYGRADARVAWYDDTPTEASSAYFSGYIEAGYRWDGVSLNLGFGFDPVVFDPVVGDYQDIGRTRFLRDAIAGGVRRSAAASLLSGLREREDALSGLETIKLECVIELN